MDFLEFVRKHKIFAVVRTESREKAAAAVKAMIEGGIRLIEVTLTVPDACQVIRETTANEDVLIGAGSVITAAQAKEAVDAGARFLVSPVFEPQVIKIAKENNIGIACGGLTPTEINLAWQQGVDLVKIFPVDAMGGVSYLKSVKAPMPHIRALVSGNIDKKNFITYLDAGAYAVSFGSSLIDPRDLDKNRMEKTVQAARSLVKSLQAYAWISGGK